MDEFKPFADDETSFNVADLTIENGTDRLAIYGNIDLARDKTGLEAARTLHKLFAGIVKTLEADPALPAALPPAPKPVAAPGGDLGLPTGGLKS